MCIDLDTRIENLMRRLVVRKANLLNLRVCAWICVRAYGYVYGKCWDGIGWDGIGWDGMGWDRIG